MCWSFSIAANRHTDVQVHNIGPYILGSPEGLGDEGLCKERGSWAPMLEKTPWKRATPECILRSEDICPC